MELLFEKSVPGRHCFILPKCDVPRTGMPAEFKRAIPLDLPEMSETDVSRHYTELCHNAFGVNCGFYPLGSCTMKYNPRINEEIAAMPEFTCIHPLQPSETVRGCRLVIDKAEKYLCEITGTDAMTFQPAAGAHGEFTGLLLIKAYHLSRNDTKRKKIIIPDSAHGTNPASASMAGFQTVSVPSGKDGCVDIEKLSEVLGDDTAGLMLTNPNTLGLFDKNILKITKMVHDSGGLTYYDGANLNAIMGVVRPGDMGFDVVHLNLHKTFSTPHGGGGPGSGPVGCKAFLREFLPKCTYTEGGNGLQVKSFYGNFLVVVKALAYILTLGAEGIREAASTAVLNANYLMSRISETYEMPYRHTCMHEFVTSLESLKKETGVSALDVAKSLIDWGMHPPTMYFPLIVHEALMFEPTETESKQTLDKAADILIKLYKEAHENPSKMKEAPTKAYIRRPDEVRAARSPILRYDHGK